MITKELSKTLFKFMGINISKQNPRRTKAVIPANDSLEKLIQDYRRLITLSEPSEAELQRIEEILERAVDDTELSQLIDKADEEFAKEKGLLEENYFENKQQDNQELYDSISELNDLKNKSSKIVMSTQKVIPFPGMFHHQVQQPPLGQKRKFFSGILLGATVTTVAFTFMHILCNSGLFHQEQANTTKSKNLLKFEDIRVLSHLSKQKLFYQISDFTDWLNTDNYTSSKQNIFNIKTDLLSSNYHVNWFNDSKWKESIEELRQQIYVLENQQKQAENMQRVFEKRQRLAESDQTFYEKRQQLAELRRSPQEVQQFRVQAQEYKAKAQQYRNTAQEYRNKAQQLLITAHSYRRRVQELSIDAQTVSFSSNQ